MANQYKNKVVYNGTTLIDLSDTTAVQSDVASGKYFYTASGERVLGTAETGGSSGYTRTVVVPEQTVTPTYHSSDITNGYSAQLNNLTEMFEQWSEYIVTFNGTEYYFTTLLMWGSNFLMGEQAYLWSGGSGTNYPYPFCVISTSINDSYIYTASADSITVKIEKLELTGSGSGGGSYIWETKSDQGITITSNETYNYAYWTYTEPLQENETYRITWGENGTQYICQTVATQNSAAYDGYYLGNASIVNVGENTGEPFILYRNNSTTMIVTTTQSTGSWRIKVEKQVASSTTLISKTITENGTYSATDDYADGYSSVTVNVPSSAASSWTKVAETSYQVSTTSTNPATVATWATGHSEIWTSDKIVYIRIRDTAGKRAGYFFGSDNYFHIPPGEATSNANGARFAIRYTSGGDYGISSTINTTGYGVFIDTVYNDGGIRIRKRYNSSYSLTVNGTYKVEVYLLDPPTGAPIFE